MHNKSVKGRRGNPTDHEKILCDVKDHRQHGLIKKRHVLTKVFQILKKKPNAFLR